MRAPTHLGGDQRDALSVLLGCGRRYARRGGVQKEVENETAGRQAGGRAGAQAGGRVDRG